MGSKQSIVVTVPSTIFFQKLFSAQKISIFGSFKCYFQNVKFLNIFKMIKSAFLLFETIL